MTKHDARIEPHRFAPVLSLGSALLSILAAVHCGTPEDPASEADSGAAIASPACPPGTAACGDGCIPSDAVCCDDGTRTTSSYCSAGGRCFANTSGRCAASLFSRTRARFCCGASGASGSNDCGPTLHHCGSSCSPLARACAPSGDAGSDDAAPTCGGAGARCSGDDECCYAGCIDGACDCARRNGLCSTTRDCCAGEGECVDGFCGWPGR